MTDKARRAQSLYDGIPPAVAVPRDERLEVRCCPYCGGVHRHAPGYGTRFSHCHSGEYVLVPPYGATVTGPIEP
jgi:hypothetical protein